MEMQARRHGERALHVDACSCLYSLFHALAAGLPRGGACGDEDKNSTTWRIQTHQTPEINRTIEARILTMTFSSKDGGSAS